MSRTDLDATTIANSLRMMAGDGSMEWVIEPIQASVLLDIADMLDKTTELRAELGRLQLNHDMWHDRAEDMRNRLSAKQAENAKLRELVQEALASHEKMCTQRGNCFGCQFFDTEWSRACPIVTVNRSARELGIEVDE